MIPDEIKQQVLVSCPCFSETENIDSMISQLISLLSSSMCWGDGLCPTFLKSLRTDTITYSPSCFCGRCKSCSEQYLSFPLKYYHKDAITEIESVRLIKYEGLTETEIPLESTDYAVRKGALIIDTSKIPSNCCTCSCIEYELVVDYQSGFDELPDCLLPVFCDLLVTISLSVTGCGSLEECCIMDKPKAYSYLKQKTIQGMVSYSWGIDTDNVSYLYDKLLGTSKLKLLASMSLCKRYNYTPINTVRWQ